MTGSLIRKFIQVQATTIDDWLDVKQYLCQQCSLRNKRSKSRQNRKREKKKGSEVGKLWKFLLQLCRNKHPLIFHELPGSLFSRLLRCDQKSGKRNVKMLSIILQKCCETVFLQSLTRIGHPSVSRWLADISRIKPTWVSHLIDCSAFFLLCCCLQYRHSC